MTFLKNFILKICGKSEKDCLLGHTWSTWTMKRHWSATFNWNIRTCKKCGLVEEKTI